MSSRRQLRTWMIHDIARTVKTYKAGGFYIVNPIEEQRSLAQEIIRHWREGYGARYNAFRRAAFELIKLEESLQSVIDDIIARTRRKPKTVVTGANFTGNVFNVCGAEKSFKEWRRYVSTDFRHGIRLIRRVD